VDQAIACLPRVLGIDRRGVRRRFEQRFSAARMAADYVRLYERLLKQRMGGRHSSGDIEVPSGGDMVPRSGAVTMRPYAK